MGGEGVTPRYVLLGTIIVSLIATFGCGPIEVDRPEPGPPYIHPNKVSPPGLLVVTSGPETFTANGLYDPNREDVLHVAWMSQSLRGPTTSTVAREGDKLHEINKGKYYKFESTEFEVDPCDQPEGRSTVTLYVSDRSFQSTSENGVEPRPGAFVVERSWTLDFDCRN